MHAKYFSIIQNYALSVSSQRKYNFYHQNTLLNAFRTNSRNSIGRNPSMVIPLLANQDLMPMIKLIRLVHFIKTLIFNQLLGDDFQHQIYLGNDLPFIKETGKKYYLKMTF